jgi:hypothetical protein
MKASAIRDRLYDYIRLADDKKVKAIYTMLEGEIENELEWWQNNDFLKELDDDYKEWKSGKAKGYTMEEVSQSIDQLRAKRGNR